ncbi:MAG: hypothetical protein AMJ62_04190 [Myxococcales bacterium SG8_38]|nr:MAG: hypothetical protein AMJ62_04190 [Myxococcales bacterium SG8_38]
MHMLKQMDARFYEEVVTRQARVWADLREALASTLGYPNPGWAVTNTAISIEEVMEDLHYGRDSARVVIVKIC